VTTSTTERPEANAAYVGNDRLLFGIILGVLAFWLFAQTTLNIASTMATDLGIQMSVMNIAVSITALFSGIFIVVLGGLADRVGRVKVVQWGFVLSIVGSLLVGVAPSGALASTSLLVGRICQGLSGACIMPASLALVKAYWDGEGRQRAVSLWSMGSWGGSGFAALFGGLMAQNVGWRWIFFAAAAVSVLGMLMVRGTPESRAEAKRGYGFDTIGILTFMIAMLALQVFATQGAKLGWMSVASLGLLAVAVVFGVVFFRTESHNINAFVDFRLFRNMTYTGATLSNLLLNAVAGILLVAMTLVQIGGGMSAQGAGLLTLGYAIAIVAFIRVGEKLLQRLGPRKANGLGISHRGPVGPAANSDLHPARHIQDPGNCCLYALWHRVGLLRHAIHGCRARESPGRPGWRWIGHLQDGLLAWRVLRRGDFGRDLHGVECRQRPGRLDRGGDHICWATGQPRNSRSGLVRICRQSPDGRGGDRLDHADGAQGKAA